MYVGKEITIKGPLVQPVVFNEPVELLGDDGHLRSVKIRDGEGHVVERLIGGLFVMIGADPCTEWLKSGVGRASSAVFS